MTDNDLMNSLKQEMETGFSGWDFSHLTSSGRMQEFPLTWNYRIEISNYISHSNCLLDMGTGGGEFLSSLKNLPGKTSATEGYTPNIEIARKRLSAKGIEVRKIEDDKLPFDEDAFDLVINRHESFIASEVKKVLANNGIFITQQVGSLNDYNLNMDLGAKMSEYTGWGLVKVMNELVGEKFVIVKMKECITHSRFYDAAAIAYYLKCIPWQIEDFSIDKYFNNLRMIQKRIEDEWARLTSVDTSACCSVGMEGIA